MLAITEHGHEDQQVQAQQNHQRAQEQYARSFQVFADAADSEFDSAIKNEPVETVRAVREALPAVFQKYGVDQKLFSTLYRNNDVVRSAPFQRMLYDLGKYHLAREAVPRAVSRPVPQVVKPGTSGEPLRGEDGRYSDISRAFMENPTAKAGAELLIAQRAARGRR